MPVAAQQQAGIETWKIRAGWFVERQEELLLSEMEMPQTSRFGEGKSVEHKAVVPREKFLLT